MLEVRAEQKVKITATARDNETGKRNYFERGGEERVEERAEVRERREGGRGWKEGEERRERQGETTKGGESRRRGNNKCKQYVYGGENTQSIDNEHTDGSK